MDVTFHDAGEFEKWLRRLDRHAADRVAAKLRYAAKLGGPALGMPLVRPLGDGLHEVRVSTYRVYFVVRADAMHVLTCGNKDTQARDIERARRRLT